VNSLSKRTDLKFTYEDAPKPIQKRRRFQWNRDYDELVRDAAVIIRARCKISGGRLDWGAFEQVFPAVNRGSVRQRFVNLEKAPGASAYLDRLEEKWTEVWVQYRGTPDLPDSNPMSATEFDLAFHIEFLRKHIDKNALYVAQLSDVTLLTDFICRRVGYTEDNSKSLATLPSSLDSLIENFDVSETIVKHPTYDFVWSDVVEDSREKRLVNQCFSLRYEEALSVPGPETDGVGVAESIVKVIL
jgi:oxalate---CoA ligase